MHDRSFARAAAASVAVAAMAGDSSDDDDLLFSLLSGAWSRVWMDVLARARAESQCACSARHGTVSALHGTWVWHLRGCAGLAHCVCVCPARPCVRTPKPLLRPTADPTPGPAPAPGSPTAAVGSGRKVRACAGSVAAAHAERRCARC